MPVILPHQLIQYLHDEGINDIDERGARDYWQHCVQHTEWAATHPCTTSAEPCLPIPTFAYGDDVKFNNNEKLTCMYLGMLLSAKRDSMRTHFPMFVIREVHMH